MNLEFKYSWIHTINYYVALILITSIIFFWIYDRPNFELDDFKQVICWLLFLGFLAFTIIKWVFSFSKWEKQPKTLTLTDRSIKAEYRTGKIIEIDWKDIKEILVKKDKSTFIEYIIIVSKKDLNEIVCNSQLGKYSLFKETVVKLGSHQVT